MGKYWKVRDNTSTRHTKGHKFEVGQVASGGSNFSGDCSGDAEPEYKHSDAGCSRYSEPVNAIQNKKAIMTQMKRGISVLVTEAIMREMKVEQRLLYMKLS